MRLLHVMLRVGNLPPSIEFYTRLMGLSPIRTTERPGPTYSPALLG